MAAKPSKGSILLVREYFDSQNANFIEELRRIYDFATLGAFVDQWKTDKRPWAREQIFAYLEQPLDRPGHNVVIKRLFKYAEHANDIELLSRFVVLFDRLVDRYIGRKYEWDRDSRRYTESEFLAIRKNCITPATIYEYTTWNGKKQTYLLNNPGDRLFSNPTRNYVRKRAWRYFRKLGYRDSEAFLKSATQILSGYEDKDLKEGLDLLDSWSLMNICYRYCDVLEFTRNHVKLNPDKRLADLSPAPKFPEHWKSDQGFEALFGLLFTAKAHAVRLWATQLLKAHHQESLSDLPAEQLLRLLDHSQPDIQEFGATLLTSSKTLNKLPLQMWLKLTETNNLTALEAICSAMKTQVTPDRLSLEQCVQLACARTTPVARMGLEFLKGRNIQMPDERRALADLAYAKCSAVGAELATWALNIVGNNDVYDRDLVLAFFDSLLEEIRVAAWKWMTKETTAYQDPGLWTRLLETPYQETRLQLIDTLQQRANLPGTTANDLTPVWTSVLLGVHSGGRQKAKSVQQITKAILKDPTQLDRLLPVLVVALRSIRKPEFRAGLSAVLQLIEAKPQFEATILEQLPELSIPAGQSLTHEVSA